jgi:hypothetical protein
MLEQIITFIHELREQLLAVAPNAVHDKLASLPMPVFTIVVGALVAFLFWSIVSLLLGAFGGKKGLEIEDDAKSKTYEPERRSRNPDVEILPSRAKKPFDPFERPDRAPERMEPVLRRDEEPAPAPRETVRAESPAAPRAAPAFTAAPAEPDGPTRADFDAAMAHGDRLASHGDFVGADTAFSDALAIARELALDARQDITSQRMVARALHRVGDVAGRLGDSEQARHHHEQALVMLRRLFAQHPDDVSIGREVAVTLERLGAGAMAAGDRPAARTAFEEELRIASQIAAREPRDFGWMRFKAVVYIMLGNLNEADHRAHYEEARRLLEVVERGGALQGADGQTLNQLRAVLRVH